jgi:G3E family GTPase
MIAVTIVSGFLGAGKTTWLAEVAAELGPEATLVVNEMAPLGVDDVTLAADTDSQTGTDTDGHTDAASIRREVIPITGGCVCCERKAELREVLISLIDRSRGSATPRAVIIETTGLAELGPLVALLSEDPVLTRNAELSELVVLVDGVGGGRELRHRPLAREQVQRADRVVISKADLVPGDLIDQTAALLRLLNPAAIISSATGGIESPLDEPTPEALAQASDVADEPDDQASSAAARPEVWVRALPASLSWAEFSLWFDALVRAHPDRILRSKGTIPTPSGRVVLQSVSGTVPRPRPAPPSAPGSEGAIVVITDGISPTVLERSFDAFVPSGAIPTSHH